MPRRTRKSTHLREKKLYRGERIWRYNHSRMQERRSGAQMKITIINGQNHKGSTRMIARELAEKLGGEISEFFLPRDFD